MPNLPLNTPLVAVVMGSKSDWDSMFHTVDLLKQLNISFHCQVVSAHRTPDLLMQFAEGAKTKGYKVIIAAAGGAAHLPGMIASKTSLPVVGVPIQSNALNGMDSLLSIAQMPGGIPVGTMSIGTSGAKNAALYAASILSTQYPDIEKAYEAFRQRQTETVLSDLYFE